MRTNITKAARALRGATQQDLARVVGCSEAMVSKIETGRAQPSRELRERIAEVLSLATWEVGL